MEHISRAKKIFFYVLLIFIFFIFIAVSLELGLRVFYWAKKINAKPPAKFDEYLGWQTVAKNVSFLEWPGYGKVVYSTKKYGFRVFGDPATDKFKIFVLGDSFTAADVINDGRAYYNYLAAVDPNIEIFAYGGAGYSSYQEYLVLDKYIDEIKPDLILWQFCSNDIINNSYQLESLSYKHNNQMTRPYYDKDRDQTLWFFPGQDYGWLYNLSKDSYLLKLLNINLNIKRADKKLSIEDRLTKEDNLYKEAMDITQAIMSKVKQRAGTVPVVAFSADIGDFPVVNEETFGEISSAAGLHYISYINKTLKLIKYKGAKINEEGNEHWNQAGHYFVGKMIYEYFQENNLLNKY